MKKLLIVLLVTAFTFGCSDKEAEKKGEETPVEQNRPQVVMETDMGRIVFELFPDVAPNTVKNFLDLVRDGFYDGLIFHRVVPDFVIQTGSPDGTPAGHAGYTIPAEFSNLPHNPGTIAMAHGSDPNSASSQFYICLSQLSDLDGKYTIFGQTIEGMEVVLKIGKVETEEGTERPVEPVKIIRMYEKGDEPAEQT